MLNTDLYQQAGCVKSAGGRGSVVNFRTDKVLFYNSKPATALLWSTTGCLVAGWTLPYWVLGRYMGFMPPPFYMVLYIILLVMLYLVSAAALKRWLLYREEKKRPPQVRRQEQVAI